MQNLRILRQRIRSVQNTQKITQAMQMVAGAKLRRAQEELLGFRPYADRLKGITQRFLDAHPGLAHPLLKGVRPLWGEKVPGLIESAAPAGLVVVSSDTGLCGTYNERVLSAAQGFLRENPSAVVVTIGKKGSRVLARRGIQRTREILDWGGRYESSKAAGLAEWMQELYLNGAVSSWWVAYTKFLSALRWKAVVEQLLPIERGQTPLGVKGARSDALPEKMIVEPSADAVAEELLARFAAGEFRRTLLEAFTSEHSARMIAMKNATDNAAEMIEHLTLVRNKARQAAITKELIEVVSGAEALK